VGGPVTLDVLDAQGVVIRSYSSDDPVIEPDPALNPEAYDQICRNDPSAPDCNQPLYWPAPQMVLSTQRGMHRFSWDLRFDPVIGEEPRAASSTGAVPGHTYPSVNAPWAPAGEYTVRLTVNGRSWDQPLSLRLDPRVQTPAADLARLADLSREMYDGAVALQAAYDDARALMDRLSSRNDADARALREDLEALAPEERGGGGGFRFFRASPSGPPTLNGVSRTMLSAAMGMQDADVAPTEREVAACAEARRQYEDVMARWEAVRARAGG
jgi:hypothetical protein